MGDARRETQNKRLSLMYHLTLFINHFIIIYLLFTLYFKYILQLSTPICNINLWYYHVFFAAIVP